MTLRLRFRAAIGLTVILLISVNPVAASAVPQPTAVPAHAASFMTSTAVQSRNLEVAPADFSLVVSPTRITIAASAIGQQQQISVINRAQSPAAVTVQYRDFSSSVDGTVQYVGQSEYSAADWITATPKDFTLSPGQTQNVILTVAMPKVVEPGDHQVSVVFMVPGGDSTTNNVKINRGIGVPIYITVPGAIDDSVTLENLTAPTFATGGPVTITASVKNTGTVHRDYRGETPLLVDAPGVTAPFPDFTVARGSTRDIATTWDPPLLGIFNPTVTMTNADGTTSSASVRVIIFPIQKAAILLGALLLLFLGSWFFRRRYKASVRKAALTMNSATGGGDA